VNGYRIIRISIGNIQFTMYAVSSKNKLTIWQHRQWPQIYQIKVISNLYINFHDTDIHNSVTVYH